MTDSSAETAPSPSDLDESATMTVADALKIILANSYAVYLKTKNFHWHVSGPYFRDYHLLLDEQAAEILAATDAMAERARKTGNTTIRSIGDIARHQTIKDNDAEFVVTVRDDGVGFDPARLAEAEAEGRMGVSKSIRGRMTSIGGTVDLFAQPGEGTEWELHIPLEGTNRA